MNKMKMIGILATVIGMGATLVSDWVKDRETEEMINEKIQKAMAEKEKES